LHYLLQSLLFLLNKLAEQFVFDDVDYVKSENIRVIWDGKQIEFDVEPQIVNGRTLVPAVEWDAESQTVKDNSDDGRIKFYKTHNRKQ
jgi:hypothetical protein